MNYRICSIALALAGVQALSSAQYNFFQPIVPAGLQVNNDRGPVVSRHGKYFILTATDASGNVHGLLYGPDVTKTPQDLSGSAGPYGPNTNGRLWLPEYLSVNDKGEVLVAELDFGNGSYDLYSIYRHQNHSLSPVLSGPNPNYAFTLGQNRYNRQILNNRDIVGLTEHTSNGTQRSAMWLDPIDPMHLVFPGSGNPSSSVVDLGDDNFLIGNYVGDNGITLGYYYQPSTAPTILNPYSPTWEYYTTILPSNINDLDQIVGSGYKGNGGEIWVTTPNTLPGVPPTYLFMQGQKILQPWGTYMDTAEAIDNFGRILGYEQQNNTTGQTTFISTYYVWYSGNSSATPCLSLLPPGADQPNTYWFFTQMDMNGTIYGTEYDQNGNFIPFLMTP